jgi:hypothetical protein
MVVFPRVFHLFAALAMAILVYWALSMAEVLTVR